MHLAEMLHAAGEHREAVRHAAAVLQRDPTNVAATNLIAAAAGSDRSVRPASGDDREQPAVDSSPSERSDTDVLRSLDAELADIVPPQFADEQPSADGVFDVERTGLLLADVGGMAEVKARLEASVLAPIRNPELGRL
jgi:hypothetical protein